MNKVFAAGVLLSIAALASPAYAQGDGNGGLSGNHYNLKILGKDNCSGDDLVGSNRHTIQVLLKLSDATPTDPTPGTALDKRNKIFLQPGDDFQVLDGNACDGDGAWFQLPPNPFSCPETDPECLDSDPTFQEYQVWARARSGGGSATITTCRQDKVTLEFQCSTENTLDVLTRTKGKNTNNFSNVTKQLTTVCLDTDGDGACNLRSGIFEEEAFSYFWDYDNNGLRLAQLRFYPIPD